MTTIQKLLGLPPVNVWDMEKTSPNTPIMGIELELENIRDWTDWEFEPFIRKEDGSLRNRGSEFVSYPLTSETLKEYVRAFYDRNKVDAKNISERCSVHIHLNCQDLTIDKVGALCQVYQVFEKLLFNFIGNDRDKNIFCVPWHQTNITHREVFKTPLQITNFKQWYKYTALNLLPLFEYGTLEFRHMGGQPSSGPIVQWINLIKHLWKFSTKTDPKELELILIGLNTTSQYDMLVDRVFEEDAVLFKTDNYKECLEDGVLFLKYMLFDNYNKPEPVKPSTFYDDLLNEPMFVDAAGSRHGSTRPAAMVNANVGIAAQARTVVRRPRPARPVVPPPPQERT